MSVESFVHSQEEEREREREGGERERGGGRKRGSICEKLEPILEVVPDRRERERVTEESERERVTKRNWRSKRKESVKVAERGRYSQNTFI